MVWSRQLIEHGYFTVGVEPMAKNRRLLSKAFSSLGYLQNLSTYCQLDGISGILRKDLHLCDTRVGTEFMDFGVRLSAAEVAQPRSETFLSEMRQSRQKGSLAGLLHILSVGLGQTAETVTVRNKNEFTSLVRQGYLDSDGQNHPIEAIAVLTLDDLFYGYIHGHVPNVVADAFMATIDLLKAGHRENRG